MRVSTTMLHQSMLAYVQRASARMLTVQRQIASGERLHAPSDDPAAAARVLVLNSTKSATEQNARNVDRCRVFAEASEATLARLTEIVTEARTLGTEAASDSYGASETAAFAAQIDALIEEALAEANRSEGGVHLYAGEDTSRPPLTATRDAAGRIVSVARSTPDAGEGALQRLVDDHVLLTINTPGTDVFGENVELFDHLIALRDAAAANDHTAVAGQLDALDNDLERVAIAQAGVGVLLQTITSLDGTLASRTTAVQASRSELADTDMAEAIVAYQREQTMLQAALSATSQMLNLSLANLIGQ